MTKIYIIGAIVIAIVAAYWAGGRIASERCRADNAIATGAAHLSLSNEIINTREEINAKVFNTTTADIRDRLRVQYTIRD